MCHYISTLQTPSQAIRIMGVYELHELLAASTKLQATFDAEQLAISSAPYAIQASATVLSGGALGAQLYVHSTANPYQVPVSKSDMRFVPQASSTVLSGGAIGAHPVASNKSAAAQHAFVAEVLSPVSHIPPAPTALSGGALGAEALQKSAAAKTSGLPTTAMINIGGFKRPPTRIPVKFGEFLSGAILGRPPYAPTRARCDLFTVRAPPSPDPLLLTFFSGAISDKPPWPCGAISCIFPSVCPAAPNYAAKLDLAY